MDLDAEQCLAAMRSRDARFDGRFFVGVRTTGIYCRPVCPARTPRPENVAFYPSAAAAEAAGFRACRRCRPETAPGTSAWIGTAAVVGRAVRLIDGGADPDAETLGARLGIGGRQLRRLFAAHLGVSPAALARARRVHLARRLLEGSAMPVDDVAQAVGLGSARALNYALHSAFGRSARELRGTVAMPGIALRLAVRPPFDAANLLAWFAKRAIPGLEQVSDGVYRRGGVALCPDGACVRLTLDRPDGIPGVVAGARRLFDLDADSARIEAWLARDPMLAPHVAARPGLRVPGSWDPFETAVRGILGQQVSVAAATTLAGRLWALTGSFAPSAVAVADLGSLGIPARRAHTLRTFAEAVASGALALNADRGLDDFVARMCALPGIGPWTAHYVAMRGLGEPDAFPSGDLGLHRATGLGARALEARAEAWRPFRAYAAIHLWNSL